MNFQKLKTLFHAAMRELLFSSRLSVFLFFSFILVGILCFAVYRTTGKSFEEANIALIRQNIVSIESALRTFMLADPRNSPGFPRYLEKLRGSESVHAEDAREHVELLNKYEAQFPDMNKHDLEIGYQKIDAIKPQLEYTLRIIPAEVTRKTTLKNALARIQAEQRPDTSPSISSTLAKDEYDRLYPQPDTIESKVLDTGRHFENFSPDHSEFRMTVPVLAAKACLECHSLAVEGQPLGAITVVHSLKRSASIQAVLGWQMALLALIAVAGVFFLKRGESKAWAISKNLERNEEKLKAATERLEAATEGSSEGLWDFHIEEKAAWYSNRFWTLLGFTHQDNFPPATFTSFVERLHPDDVQRTLRAAERNQTLGEPYDVEYRLRLVTGNYRWFRARGNSTHDESGRAIRMAGSIQDIHDRRIAKMQLKEGEAFLERVEKIAGVGGWQLNLLNMEPEWTAQTCRIHEVPLSYKPKLSDAIEYFAPNARPIIQQKIDECITNGISWDIELPLTTHTGKNIWVRTLGERELENGIPVRLVGTIQDVTDRKRANDDLSKINEDLSKQTKMAKKMAAKAQRAAEAKSAFLATMSHEIRTPMNGVVGMTELLSGTELTPEQKDYVNSIRISGDSLLTVINDILDFSKIEAGKVRIEKRTIDLWQIIEGVMDIVSFQAREKMLDLSVFLSKNVPSKCIGDAGRLRQVLLNLLSNAIKFTNHGGVKLDVAVVADLQSEYKICFSIIDSGIGIDPTVCEELFSPFTQADDSISRKYGGTGLGLVISRRLSELMGGTVSVESTKGLGSTFRFTCSIGKATSSAAFDTANALQGIQILIADNNEKTRRTLKQQFETWGACTYCASTVEEMQALIELKGSQGEQFPVVFLDMRLGGIELLHWTREHCHSRSTRIVAMELAGERELTRDSVDGASDIYLTKPLKYSILLPYLVRARSLSRLDNPIVESERFGAILGCFQGTYAQQMNQAFDMVFKDADPAITRCRESIENQNALAAERAAHSIKGIAGELGAIALLESSIRIMDLARDNKLDEARRSFPAMQKELERVRNYLKGFSPENDLVPAKNSLDLKGIPSTNPMLVVDDIAMNRKVLKTILTKAGYNVIEASSGEEALRHLQLQSFSSVFMDVMMPDMDGLETVRRLRKGPGPNVSVNVIGVSASILEEDRVRCFESGMNEFIAKPIDQALLLAVLTRLLRESGTYSTISST